MRAPLDIPAHVIQAGRRKPARVYTLSSGGVYLDTQRPSMRNAAISVELDLWPSPGCAAGVVVYTSVPGNLRRANLPHGMGVRFEAIPDIEMGRIRRVVAEASLQLTLYRSGSRAGEDLARAEDLVAREDSVHHVGIARCKSTRGRERFRFEDDHAAAGLLRHVEQRARVDDTTRLGERPQVCEMRIAMLLAERCAARAVAAD